MKKESIIKDYNRGMLNPVTRGFNCSNCHKWVSISEIMGTYNRNHCPYCLWSVHVDMYREGDRLSSCGSVMKPIGLTFKDIDPNKWGKDQKGELMIVHECIKCGKASINRIAGDDESDEILKVFDSSLNIINDERIRLNSLGIKIAEEKDKEEIKKQLFGK